MHNLAFLGMRLWYVWLAIIVAILAITVMVRRASARAKLREQEQLAQLADATHEGDKTRHEGSA